MNAAPLRINRAVVAIFDRSHAAARALHRDHIPLDKFEFYVSQDVWATLMQADRTNMLVARVYDPDGMKVYLGGVRVHADSGLPEDSIRLRYEIWA